MCATPACVKAAARLLARLDPGADPCRDFYQFACGGFLETGIVPDDSVQLSTLQEMQDDLFRATKSIHAAVVGRRGPIKVFCFSVLECLASLPLAEVLEVPLSPTDASSVAKVKKLYKSCMSPRKCLPMILGR